MIIEQNYQLSKDLIVEGSKVPNGTLLSELRKRGGVWAQPQFVADLVKSKTLGPVVKKRSE